MNGRFHMILPKRRVPQLALRLKADQVIVHGLRVIDPSLREPDLNRPRQPFLAHFHRYAHFNLHRSQP